jgi:hypothetical protein
MDFDNSWGALINPGKASIYFDAFPLPGFDQAGARFSARSAYIYAEISRVIYNDSAIMRRDALKRIGWREIQFLSAKDVQCAVLTDGKELIVVFRGSTQFDDWLQNFKADDVEWGPGGRVHRGFKESFLRVENDLPVLIEGLGMPIKGLCGHSKGAGEVLILASYLDRIKERQFEVYTFGAPPTGDAAFVQSIRQPVHRVLNDWDAVGNLLLPGFEQCGLPTHLEKPKKAAPKISATRLNRLFNLASLRAPRALRSHTPQNYVAGLERLL